MASSPSSRLLQPTFSTQMRARAGVTNATQPQQLDDFSAEPASSSPRSRTPGAARHHHGSSMTGTTVTVAVTPAFTKVEEFPFHRWVESLRRSPSPSVGFNGAARSTTPPARGHSPAATRVFVSRNHPRASPAEVRRGPSAQHHHEHGSNGDASPSGLCWREERAQAQASRMIEEEAAQMEEIHAARTSRSVSRSSSTPGAASSSVPRYVGPPAPTPRYNGCAASAQSLSAASEERVNRDHYAAWRRSLVAEPQLLPVVSAQLRSPLAGARQPQQQSPSPARSRPRAPPPPQPPRRAQKSPSPQRPSPARQRISPSSLAAAAVYHDPWEGSPTSRRIAEGSWSPGRPLGGRETSYYSPQAWRHDDSAVRLLASALDDGHRRGSVPPSRPVDYPQAYDDGNGGATDEATGPYRGNGGHQQPPPFGPHSGGGLLFEPLDQSEFHRVVVDADGRAWLVRERPAPVATASAATASTAVTSPLSREDTRVSVATTAAPPPTGQEQQQQPRQPSQPPPQPSTTTADGAEQRGGGAGESPVTALRSHRRSSPSSRGSSVRDASASWSSAPPVPQSPPPAPVAIYLEHSPAPRRALAPETHARLSNAGGVSQRRRSNSSPPPSSTAGRRRAAANAAGDADDEENDGRDGLVRLVRGASPEPFHASSTSAQPHNHTARVVEDTGEDEGTKQHRQHLTPPPHHLRGGDATADDDGAARDRSPASRRSASFFSAISTSRPATPASPLVGAADSGSPIQSEPQQPPAPAVAAQAAAQQRAAVASGQSRLPPAAAPAAATAIANRDDDGFGSTRRRGEGRARRGFDEDDGKASPNKAAAATALAAAVPEGMHRVEAGDTWRSVATLYMTTEAELRKANANLPTTLAVGDLLFVG